MDKTFLKLCRLYPSVFQIDNFQQYFKENVEKIAKYSGESFKFTQYEQIARQPVEYLRTGNIRVKKYIDGSCDVLCCSENLFTAGAAFERMEKALKSRKKGTLETAEIRRLKAEIRLTADEPEQSIGVQPSDNAIRRARGRLREILLSNKFDWFVTITIDGNTLNRYDYRDIVKPLSKWLDNRVQRKGYKYVLVPEFHKDGAVHFHGLFSGDVKVEDSGTVKVHNVKKPVKMSTYKRHYKGQPYSIVYNMPEWEYGYTTAIKVTDKPHAVANYISKYISKDSRKVGGRWYLSGGKLNRAEEFVFAGDFFCFADIFKVFGIEGRNERFCAFRLSADGEVLGSFVEG